MKTFISRDEELEIRCVQDGDEEVAGTYLIDGDEVFADNNEDDGKAFAEWIRSRPTEEQIRWITMMMEVLEQVRKVMIADVAAGLV